VVKSKNGAAVPCLEITCPDSCKKRYIELAESKQQIPCANYIQEVDMFKIIFWLSRLATERLEQKTEAIIGLMTETANDLEEVFHRLLFKYFGFKINALPFEMLERGLPATLLRKYTHSLLSIESLLFGQAGLLDFDAEDEYACKLQSEYQFLKQKHCLTEMDKSLWKYAKLRPVNFPTIRLAQIAAILHKGQILWATVVNLTEIKALYDIFDVTASEYWDNHYVFGKLSAQTSPKRLGKTAIDSLIINLLVPMTFAYANYKGEERSRERAMYFLEALAPESNSMLNEWAKLGIKPANALESQALIQLHSEYCSNKRCLKCAIGKEVIQNIIKNKK
jgi:hypothetical protein